LSLVLFVLRDARMGDFLRSDVMIVFAVITGMAVAALARAMGFSG
jgi:hypothetical protein